MSINNIVRVFMFTIAALQLTAPAYGKIPEQQIVATYKGSSNGVVQLIINCREYTEDKCSSFDFIQRSIHKKTGNIFEEKNLLGPIDEKELRRRLLYTAANSKTVFFYQNPAVQVVGLIGLPLVMLAGGLIVPGVLPLVIAGLPIFAVGTALGVAMLPVAGVATGFVLANHNRQVRRFSKIVDEILENRTINRPIKIRKGRDYNSLVETLCTVFE